MNYLKTFQPFINQCKKGSMPILGEMLVQNGKAIISNIETTVSFPIQLPDGMYTVLNGEAFKNPDINPDDHPIIPEGETLSEVTINPVDLLNTAPCTGNDPVRPLLNGINLNNKHIVASDAHVLRYTPVANMPENLSITFLPAAPMLSLVKQTKAPITVRHYKPSGWQAGYADFIFSDLNCTLTTRLVDGVYPNYQGIIPNWSQLDMQCFTIDPKVLPDMVKTSKAFQTPILVVGESHMIISSSDLKLEKIWQAPENVPKPTREPDALLMPMDLDRLKESDTDRIKAEMTPVFPGSRIGLNPGYLSRIAGTHKGPIVIGFYTTSNAMAVWLQPSTNAAKAPVPFHAKAPAKQSDFKKPVETPQPAKPVELPSPKPVEIPSAETMPPTTPNTSAGVMLLEYSDRAIAVFNAPETFREAFTEAWGKYSKWLKHPHTKETTPGWVFSKKRTQQIQQIISKAS